MNSNEVKNMVNRMVKERLENRGKITQFPDPFEVSNKASAIKYVTKDGRVRLDIDFDTFKQIFNSGLWNSYMCEIFLQGNDVSKERLRLALQLYHIDNETAELCELIRLVNPMFDYRENPR